MFSLKWSALAGGFAFTLSILIGLVSGAGIVALVRALIFGALFFAAGSAVRWLIGKFLPELLDETEEPAAESGEAGSRVDISVEDDEDAGDLGTLDAGSDRKTGVEPALDQNTEDRYTKDEAEERDASPAAPKPAAVRPPEASGVVDMLPELDSMAAAFLPAIEDDEDDEGGRDEPPVRAVPSRNTATRPQGSGEDFNAKEMAQAIQTILKREDKG